MSAENELQSTMTYNTELQRRFDFHPATTAEKGATHQAARDAALRFAIVIDDIVPPGREKALAMGKIEEAMFWANAAIARPPSAGPPDHQQPAVRLAS